MLSGDPYLSIYLLLFRTHIYLYDFVISLHTITLTVKDTVNVTCTIHDNTNSEGYS
jgi:hypothetical protein